MTTTIHQSALNDLLRSLDDCYRSDPHLTPSEMLLAAEAEADRVLNLQAAEHWEKVRKSNPDDPHALHHLAVIHHGTAYRLHLEGKGKEAVEYWRKALQHWSVLAHKDGFWKWLQQRWQQRYQQDKGDMLADRLAGVDLDAFRRQLPRHLLGLHAGLVEDCYKRDEDLARRHLDLLVGSNFDDGLVEDLKQRVYKTVVGNVDEQCKSMEGEQAWQRVEAYLRLDPNSTTAKCDGLRVCTHLCDRWGKDAGKRRQLEQTLQKGDSWAQGLAADRDAVKDFLVSTTLCDFYHGWAVLLHLRGVDEANRKNHRKGVELEEEALACIRKAVLHEKGGQKSRQLLHTICSNAAMVACGAQNDAGLLAKARKFLDAGLADDSEDTLLNMVEAFYLYMAKDFKGFQKQLKKAEKLNAKDPDMNASTLLGQMKELAAVDPAELEARGSMNKAAEAIARESWHEALSHLEQAERVKSRSGTLHALKAICYLKTYRMQEALAALQAAKRYLGPDDPPEIHEMVRRNCP